MNISKEEIEKMEYVEFMAFIGEVNRPPGGISAVLEMVNLMNINENDLVLDIGCNTGYLTFEIAHLTNCKIIGIDINKNMIRQANRIKSKDSFSKKIYFKLMDARKLKFKDKSINKVVCGGSLAFIDKKEIALKEIYRVLKPWGLYGDLEFYYKNRPPKKLLNKISKILGTKIIDWDRNYWISLYENAGFEVIYHKDLGLHMYKKDREIRDYCEKMIGRLNIKDKIAKETALKKLYKYMKVFNENNKYLEGLLCICRKREYPDQVFLFYK